MPRKLQPVWSTAVSSPGLGGIAATRDLVFFSDRGINDTADVFKCVKASTGEEVWRVIYPAAGNLDYGNSPRATPLLYEGMAFLFGAFGNLLCVDQKTGKTIWEMDLAIEFDLTEKPKWGTCGSPLIVDNQLIVCPGAKDASIVSIHPAKGKVNWKTPGKAPGYGSLIVATFGNKKQIVGHDTHSLNGWDPATGKRLWTLVPEFRNDFNVPTPIETNGQLFVTTENNGSRLYQFNTEGILNPKPIAINSRLAPDTHTPVVVGDQIHGVWRKYYCLSLKDNLNPVYTQADRAFDKYCTLIASKTRILAITLDSELILLDATAAVYKELGRLRIWSQEKGLYSHPALVGDRLYLRGSESIAAFVLPQT